MNHADILELLNNIGKFRKSINKDYDVKKNVNAKICKSCGGLCCKNCGCHFSPDDFKKISFEFLKKEIKNGFISIVCVDREFILQDENVLILRIRNKGMPIVDFGYDSAPCILLTNSGCKLDYEHRPTGAKLLIPSDSFDKYHVRMCNSKYTIEDCCYEWEPYQNILSELVKYFFNKDFPCSL